MRRYHACRRCRRGAIAPLTAILTIPLMGMIAFAVDLGWITHTENELQSAADAAALAGVAQLPTNYVPYYLPGQTTANKLALLTAGKTSASTYAKTYAGYNRAGDVSSLTLLDSDIEFGYYDGTTYTALPAYTGYPNTVKVTLRRDATANGPLGMFFARVLGIDAVSLTATASATLYAGNVDSFKVANPDILKILPMTYDVNHWNNFLKTGQGPDGSTDTDSNGNPVITVYPSIKFTGNFGQLSLDQGNDGASTISGWIDSGVPNTDLQQETSAGLLPLSQHNSNLAPDWKGNPGLKESTVHTVAGHVGETYLLPLFKPVDPGIPDPSTYAAGTGNGSHYYYTIVQFVPVKIVSASGSIQVQPGSVIDPNILLTGIAPAAPPTSGSPPVWKTTFTGAKLTQ